MILLAQKFSLKGKWFYAKNMKVRTCTTGRSAKDALRLRVKKLFQTFSFSELPSEIFSVLARR